MVRNVTRIVRIVTRIIRIVTRIIRIVTMTVKVITRIGQDRPKKGTLVCLKIDNMSLYVSSYIRNLKNAISPKLSNCPNHHILHVRVQQYTLKM